MQFIKKNYEKVLLAVVLIGLVGLAVFMLFLIASEKQAQAERRSKIINLPVKPLPDLGLTNSTALLTRAEAPTTLSLSDNTHKLFNPVRWQKGADGRIFKNPVGSDVQKLEIQNITPLRFNLSLDSVTVYDTGARYAITVEEQAAAKANARGKRTYYVSPGEKKEFPSREGSFTLLEVVGAPENPSELKLELSGVDKPVSISKETPFSRVDGYAADLKFAPENKTFPGRRVGDELLLAGERYNIVAITENEIVLSAKSNQKKWTIKYNAGA